VPHFRVVLVEPLNDGNIGAVARSMKNLGLEELVLVRPCAVGEEALKRAMHGMDVLKGARTVFSDEEALKGADFVAATSGVDTLNDKKFVRISLTPREFSEKAKALEGTIALLFGREDFGLPDELIKRADFLVTIPANRSYPIMNLSHAATIVFYELFQTGFEKWKPKSVGEVETEKLHEYFAELLEVIDYPAHKKEKTKVMFRRLMARSVPSTWEYHTMMGVLDGAIDKGKVNEAGKRSSLKKKRS
jgi:tRNA/rRNA methyltransferase